MKTFCVTGLSLMMVVIFCGVAPVDGQTLLALAKWLTRAGVTDAIVLLTYFVCRMVKRSRTIGGKKGCDGSGKGRKPRPPTGPTKPALGNRPSCRKSEPYLVRLC